MAQNQTTFINSHPFLWAVVGVLSLATAIILHHIDIPFSIKNWFVLLLLFFGGICLLQSFRLTRKNRLGALLVSAGIVIISLAPIFQNAFFSILLKLGKSYVGTEEMKITYGAVVVELLEELGRPKEVSGADIFIAAIGIILCVTGAYAGKEKVIYINITKETDIKDRIQRD